MILLYRIFFPFIFLFFLPGLVVKLIRRPGRKKNYMERFGIFSAERKKALSGMRGAVWIHAVSVGETNVALSLLKKWIAEYPDRKFVFSTTTTTSQEIAWNKVPAGVEVFFCPVDMGFLVRRVLRMVRPSALVIFETEIWPNMVLLTKKSGAKVFLVNARLSDRSIRGYRRFRAFFAPVLSAFDRIGVQTELDRERFLSVAPEAKAAVTGNIKFDQCPPADLKGIDLAEFFGQDFISLLACSTHAPEEKLMLDSFLAARKHCPKLKFVIVPRHAERGNELEEMLKASGVRYYRRTSKKPLGGTVDCLLADTTGELVRFIKSSDIVLMGKTFAGNDEGQNIIEPAQMGKTIITGPEMKNFRQAFDALLKGDGVLSIHADGELAAAVEFLAGDAEKRRILGEKAKAAVCRHAGALEKTIKLLEENRSCQA